MLDLSILKSEKRKQHITYRELEEKTGISKTDICKICNGQCVTVNLKKVDLIRSALGLTREMLLLKDKVADNKREDEVMEGQMKFN